MIRDVLVKGMVPDQSLSRVAKRLGERPVEELADRLGASAAGRSQVIGASSVVTLGEVIVHVDELLPAPAPTRRAPGRPLSLFDLPSAPASPVAGARSPALTATGVDRAACPTASVTCWVWASPSFRRQ